MGQKNQQVDAYIAKSAAFSRPILIHFRDLVHKTCPEVIETVKWGMPHFEYQGVLCNMAAFKAHCSFGFWKASLMADSYNLFSLAANASMGHLGKITTLEDLPSDEILIEYITEAVVLNKTGIKGPGKTKKTETKDLLIPDYFIDTLKENPLAFKTFESFSYTNKKEYLDWVTEAKREETRNKRLDTAMEWMSQGKVRNWKYMKS